ncbi:MAG: HAD family hydrolase, partial [SAR324 cluster bacterium]|nr:HAD family hydrolase [SAR324 cluster bacterium]
MPKPYRLIAFDCVNTLYLPDASRIPVVELDGKQVPTTAGLLHERLAPLLPDLALHQAHLALRNAWRWAEAQRGPELLEVPARRRFRQFFFELGLREPEERLLDELLELHMRAVTGSFILPAAHRQVLTRLRRSHRLALFSNFDHAPSMQRLLRESGISDWFDPIIISDALGYHGFGATARGGDDARKTHPADLFAEVDALVPAEQQVAPDFIRRFVHLEADQYRKEMFDPA